MARKHNDQEAVRRYLLRQLSDAEQQAFELRLLNDDELSEELEIVEDELIDEYLTEELSQTERANFEKDFLASPERKRKLASGQALRRYFFKSTPERLPKPGIFDRLLKWTRQSFLSSPIAVAVALLIVAGLGFAVWRGVFYQSDVDKGLIALNQAYSQERPIEARISNLDYAPFVTRRGGDPGAVNTLERDRAERILLDAVRDRPGVASYHALGKFYLTKKDFDKAISQFEEALKENRSNAQVHSDLGAALLEKARTERGSNDSGESFKELAKSLEHLNKALELDSSLLEALFDRALVHEQMALPEQAEEDWKKYLERDFNSQWTNEARRHLTTLQENDHKITQDKKDNFQNFLKSYRANDQEAAWEILRRTRDGSAVGTLIRDQLLDAYLEGASAGDTRQAEDKFDALMFVGKLELERTGDVYTSKLARFYSLASPGQREILTKARELMKEGRRCYAGARPLDAIVAFDKAKGMFAGLDNHWETQYADLWLGYCYMNASDTERGLKILEPLVSSFQQQNFKWLFMRALYLLSGAEYDLSLYSKAIGHNHRALALAEEMGDAIGIFNALHVLVEQYRYIGNFEQSLDCIRRSLPLIESGVLNQDQIAQYYGTVAALLDSSGLYSAAADYQKESIKRALTTGQVQTISRAYANLGSIYGKMGDYNRALESARIAYDTARSHSDESIKKTMMAYSSRQIGDLYRQSGDINQAIKSYDECIELNKSLDNYYGLYEAHKNRLSCYKVLGNDSVVKEELETTLALVEKYRTRILEEDNRRHFFDTEQSVYDLAIDFAYSRMKSAEKAFDYAEASRSRSLLDLMNSNAHVANYESRPDIVFGPLSHPLKLSDIQKRMPAQAQIVQYSVLDEKLLIWFITKTGFSTVESDVRQEELNHRVHDYLQSISSTANASNPEVNDDAKRLFEILIKPIEPFLDHAKPVYVIPDKILNYLPFGTLISPDSNKFLVQEYLTVVSPSSSLFIISSELARKKEGKKFERLLSVGNPNFDRSEFPALAQLPSAASEAEGVAGYYESKCVLTGDVATKPRVEKEMQRSDVIHLAVHTVFDQRTPLRSKLVLAKAATTSSDERSNGVLEASEVYKMKLPTTKVVVLSACQSGIEQYYGGEGMISLGRPFLAAGVPLIVVSFWPVDSDSTVALMRSFHQHRKRDNLPTAEALRRAQLDMLSSSDERLRQPYCWAAFTAVGGWTSF